MRSSLILLFLIILFPREGFSTHLRGGQIRVIPKSNPLVCDIEITVYTNTEADIEFGGGRLDFGDGSDHTPAEIPNTDLGNGIGFVRYTIQHTYQDFGVYVVTYSEPNLNGGILNVPNSLETRFYIETSFRLTEDGVFTSPEFPVEPIFICSGGLDYAFSTAAIDNSSNNFFYRYSLITPLKGRNSIIAGYEVPENLKVNKVNGTVTWDTKFHNAFVTGVIWIVVKIDKYNADGDHLGYVQRAMQIIVEDSNSIIDVGSSVTAPDNKVVVTEDQHSVIKVVLSESAEEEQSMGFSMFISEKLEDKVLMTQYDSLGVDDGKKFQVAKVSFNTTPDILSDMPYAIVLRGRSGNYQKDVSLLYMTKDIPLPEPPEDNGEITEVMDENRKGELRVYPNPFQSQLYVDGTEAIFINSIGQVVMRSYLQKGQPVDTSALPPGFYVLKVVADDTSTMTVKLTRH